MVINTDIIEMGDIFYLQNLGIMTQRKDCRRILLML